MDISANKQDTTPSSVSQTKVVASELNQLIAEQNNVITTGGELIPSSSDTTQLLTSIQKVSKNKAEEVIENNYDIEEPWQKPSDWIDISSGAITNSIYLLVAHKADYSKYAKFSFEAMTSTTTNTYDVYVDGLKQTTIASGDKITLDWQTLALDSGYGVTYPSNLHTHVVRITPTQNTDTLTRFRCRSITEQQEQGLLWAHFELSNPITANYMFGTESDTRNYLLEAVTAKNDNLTYHVSSSYNSGLYQTFRACNSLKKIPVLTADATTYKSGEYISFSGVPLKKVVIKGNLGTETFGFLNATKVEEFDIENGVILSSGTQSGNDAHGATNLKKLPSINASNAENFQTYGLVSLQNTFIDDSSNSARKLLRFYGSSTTPVQGLKGLTVSNQAPFDGASPQINVSYTGMDRMALVNLFKSMPYNVGYTVVGSPTIVDGVASGFSENDYVQCGSLPSSITSFEHQLKFTTGNSAPAEGTYWGLSGYSTSRAGFYITSDNVLGCHWINFDTNRRRQHISNLILNNNTTYWAKWTFLNGVATIYYSTDGVNWSNQTMDVQGTASAGTYTDFCLGNTSSGTFNGSIDLNNTYININGVPWFRGTAAMTKTCSVVGCTGTADLTAADKAIATGKGWELTVA